MGILDGKRILVTGVLTDASIAFGVAKTAQEEGAEVVLTSVGRAMSLTARVSRKLPAETELYELDVSAEIAADAETSAALEAVQLASIRQSALTAVAQG